MSRRELNIPGIGKILTGLTSYSEPIGQKQKVTGKVVEWNEGGNNQDKGV